MNSKTTNKPQPKPFLGVYFENCRVYGRLYRNKAQTAYLGQCPRCGTPYQVRIGSGGSSNRFFKANCR